MILGGANTNVEDIEVSSSSEEDGSIFYVKNQFNRCCFLLKLGGANTNVEDK